MHVFTSFVLFEGEKFHGGGRVWYFNVIWLKSIHTFTFIVTVFTASASIRVSARNASLYIAVMIFCAQPYLKPCFVCPFYILSTCPSKGLCTALLINARAHFAFTFISGQLLINDTYTYNLQRHIFCNKHGTLINKTNKNTPLPCYKPNIKLQTV